MPTVIDSLVIELGLDPTNFNLQQREAFETAKRLEAQQLKAAKNIEHGAGKASTALAATRNQALQLMTLLTGGSIIAFGAQVANADAQVGRLSRNINVSAEVISKWQGAARIFGGDAQSMAQSFVAMSDAFAGMNIGQMTPLIAELRALGVAGGHVIETFDSIETKWHKVAKNLQAINAKDPATAGLMGRRLGLDPALYDAMISGNLPKVLELVEKIGAATKNSADYSARLEQNWAKLKLSVENVVRALGQKLDVPGWLNSFAEIFEGLSKGKVLKGSFADRLGKIFLGSNYSEGYTPGSDEVGLKPGAAVTAPAIGTGAFTSQAEKEAFIRAAFARRKINPNIAMAVAIAEGFNSFQSSVKNPRGPNGREDSWGAFQLYMGGGLGNEFQKKTGLDPRNPANERATIDFAADHVAKNGWGAFHGAKNTGIGRWQGVRDGSAQAAGSTTEVNIGSVTVVAPQGVNANQWAGEFERAVKARAFQANAGQS